jgi:membrane-associated HD superfamily phosphohydrolase
MRANLPCLAGCALSLLLLAATEAETSRDPLTHAEIEQLRDAAVEPELRLKLYIKFARVRLASVEQARSDPKTQERGQQIHDRLQDFLDVYDELNDNVDNYADRRWDIRKALKAVLEADTEFQARLRAVQDSAKAEAEEIKQYEFLLSNALDTLDSSVQDHRQVLSQQEEAAKHKKLIKPGG